VSGGGAGSRLERITLQANGTPRIDGIAPAAALPGGEIAIYGAGFAGDHRRPQVTFGEAEGSLILCSDSYLIARVPDGASGSTLRVIASGQDSSPFPIALGQEIADNLHPVANPAVDAAGNVYVTYSGQRGQKVPVSLYRVSDLRVKPFVTSLINPTGLALDRNGVLYVSCRNDGTVHRVTPDGQASQWVEGMGVATGIAFDPEGNLYVGDRSGTIFKINPEAQIFVFATLEPSVAAYHLAFSRAGELYVTGPTQSSFDCVYRVSPAGEVSVFYRGLGRPQGLAFDVHGNLYVAASLGGRRGIVRLTPDAKPELVLGGTGLVGLALLPDRQAMLVTGSSLFSLDWDIEGMPLFG
jgi:IPT/TIG domain/Strictosidine synthase-like, N-terminal